MINPLNPHKVIFEEIGRIASIFSSALNFGPIIA
jgi:hypothetical protein